MDGGAPSDVLLECPWLPVSISGSQYLAKTWFGDTTYHILLTDMNCVWEERMNPRAIQERAQELNKRLRAPVDSFFSHLRAVVQPCQLGGGPNEGGAQISLTRQENCDIRMKLKSELAGLPFYWEFRCSPARLPMVCGQLLHPLLVISRLLQKQVEQLGSLMIRKDAEIQDYRENGATLSRERLQTELFDEQTFQEDFVAQNLPQVCSEQQAWLGFDTELQDMYAAFAAHQNGHKRKQSEGRAPSDSQQGTESVEIGPDTDCTPPPGEGSVSSEPSKRNGEQGNDGQKDKARAKMADGARKKQPDPVIAAPTDYPAPKPKKKKVGLFR